MISINKSGENSKFDSIIGVAPFPACVIGKDGTIVEANSYMEEVIVYSDILEANFFALTGIKREAIVEASKNGEMIIIERNDKSFEIKTSNIIDEEGDITVFFVDRTERLKFNSLYENNKPVFIFVSIDNYDELLSSITTDSKRAVPTEVDRIVRKWADSHESPILGIEEDEYVMFTTREQANIIMEENFSVLDEVRQIDTKIDFPVSISIGMGSSDHSLAEGKDLAEAARELALGRGGDQAVVKDDNQTFHYGGTLQSMEKNNRGKSRVIAHALKNLIKESQNVVVMGHRMPDMDSFGAALGAYRMCKFLEKDAIIVIEEHNEALDTIYRQAEATEEYNIVRHNKALEFVNENTLCIIVDTNRPHLTECPEILDICKQKVVIDHHRLADDSIAAPTIAYIESYASSASELITEVLQYFSQKRFINKFEAEALLAGIMVDTNNYSSRSGVRTFEAAAWLKRAGADTAEVKRFFRTDIQSFKARAAAIANAEYTPDKIAFARNDCFSDEAAIINAQVADELITVKGVQAAFVIGMDNKMKTLVSARSIGDINVQAMMETLGGGGHYTAAAAQLSISPDEAREEIDKMIRKLMDASIDKEEN